MAAVMLGAGTLSGCSASLGGIRCDFKVNHPHESKGSPGWMEGKATLRCTGAIDSAEGVVKMQRMSQGKWRDVAGTRFSRTIRPVKAETTYTIMTADKLCSDGTYRVAAKGSGVLKGHPRASMACSTGAPRRSPASDIRIDVSAGAISVDAPSR